MSAVDDGTATPRRRARTTRAKRPGHRTRKFTVPTNVQPGWVHNLAAALTVRALDRRDIDGGKIDEEMISLIPGAEDAPEPAELLARIYAHLAYRIPGIRTMAKRFEGSDPKSGLGADLLAFSLQLWLRNRDLFAEMRRQADARRATDTAESRSTDRVNLFTTFTRKSTNQKEEGS